MNNETPRRIAPDCQPAFPCWLCRINSNGSYTWSRYEVDPVLRDVLYRYWHPDQPTAPTCVPDAPAPTPQPAKHPAGMMSEVAQTQWQRVEAWLDGSPAQPAPGTPTPRTDAISDELPVRCYGTCDAAIHFARTLERELAEAKEAQASVEHNYNAAVLERADHRREFSDLRTRLTAAERQLALADELAGALEDMTIAFVTTFTASHDQKDAATCKAVAALTRYRAATAPSKSP